MEMSTHLELTPVQHHMGPYLFWLFQKEQTWLFHKIYAN